MRLNSAARAEYAYLRELGAGVIAADVSPRAYAVEVNQTEPAANRATEAELEIAPELNAEHESYEEDMQEEAEPAAEEAAGSAPVLMTIDVLKEINPEYSGWIFIPGTVINYPVARGADNEKYLETTFTGGWNPAGTIYMDYRCADGFGAAACLIYGHNMRDGSMFSALIRYLDGRYLESNPEIIVSDADGRMSVYRITEARRTDAWDGAYSIGSESVEMAPGFIDGDGRLLILSTCLNGADTNGRLLIFAVTE